MSKEERKPSSGIASLLVIATIGFFIHLALQSSGTSGPTGGSSYASKEEANQAQVAISEVSKDAASLLDPNAAYDPNSGQYIIDRPDSPKAQGAYGEVEGLMKRFSSSVLESRHRYQSELEAIGWFGILEPSRVPHLVRTGKGQRIIERARALASNQEERLQNLLGSFREDIETLEISAEMRESLTDGLARGLVSSSARNEAIFQLERDIVDSVDRMYAFLTDIDRQDWGVENNQIVFMHDWQVEAFNQEFSAMNAAIAEQSALLQGARDEVLSNLSDMDYQFEAVR